MIVDAYSDRYETGRCACLAWRCLNFGELIDSQILAHRMVQKRKAAKSSSAVPAMGRSAGSEGAETASKVGIYRTRLYSGD